MSDINTADTLEKRRTDVISLKVKSIELTNKYNDLLLHFGYKDINVIPQQGYYASGKQYLEINKVEIYFWEENYEYQLRIERAPARKFDNINKCLNTEEFVLICNEMLQFIANSNFLRCTNMKDDLVSFLESNHCEIVYISHLLSNENNALIQANKEGFYFTYYIQRLNVEESNMEDDAKEDDQPITERFQKELDNLKNIFDNYLHDELKVNSYECKIDPNVYKFTIIGNGKEHEIISYRSNFFDPQVIDKIQSIMHSILKVPDVIISLEKKNFHLHKNPKNDNSFFACIEGEKFEIKLAIERLVECRSSFEKLTGKKLTLDFDNMDGYAFERFCADILAANGFESVRVTQGSGDQGIDIIAFKDGIKYGIQCKCYSSDIGNKAVQEAFAGKTFYDCHVGIVLTNQHFTLHAIELAKKNGIVLWDRNKLLTMIKKANN